MSRTTDAMQPIAAGTPMADADPRPRPRHCMVVHAYYPLTETRVQREAEALVAAGFEVDVICPRGEAEAPRERYRGVKVHRLPVRIEKSDLGRQFLSYLHFCLRAGGYLSRLQRSRPYDTVQVHNLPDFLVFCAIVPKLQNVPVILDLHDLMPEFFAARFMRSRPVLLRLVRWQERLACRFADHVITVTEHWRQVLIERKVPADRCSVVMNVADENIFVPRTETSPARGSFHLLYHGSVTRRYGLDLAIRAIALVKDEVPGIRLTIRGAGQDRPALLELRRELGLEGHIDLIEEHVPESDLPAIIAQADAAVVPYRDDVFTDGILPTKLMEYAAVGIPCIAARTTAIESYFRDANVEFFTPGDVGDLARAIRLLSSDPAYRAALGARSRRFTERYSWTRLGPEYVALIRRLAAERARFANGSPRR